MKEKRIKVTRLSRSRGTDIFLMVLITILGVFMAWPLVFAVSNSLKPLDELYLFPPQLFVQKPTTSNFETLSLIMAESWVPFSRYIFNTVFITVAGTTGHVLIASMAAFALTKYRFPGKNLIFALVVMSLMFAPQVTAIPNYIIMSSINIIDTYWAVILPAWGSALGLFLMKQFMEQMVPDAIVEAARIDGAGVLRTLFTIVLPIVKPAWLTLIILSVQALWNNNPTVVIYSEELKTLAQALSQIAAGGFARTGASAAVAVIMMIVPISTFVITQSNIVETMATSGIKE